MKERICENCKYFHQHYGVIKDNYFKVDCGHCTAVSVKKTKPDKKACERYVEAKDD